MNTIPTTTAAPILAIDLGKYKSVACVYDPATAQATFTTVRTTQDEIDGLLSRHPSAVVVVEACTVSGWVHDLCQSRQVTCIVANTSGDAWKFTHTKRKTDKDDALRLAQLYALGQLPCVTVPIPAVRQWRALIATRQALIQRRVAVQNRLRALLLAQGVAMRVGARAWTVAGLAELEARSKPLEQCGADEVWRGLLHLALIEYRQVVELSDQLEAQLDQYGKTHTEVQRLRTIPGVGPRTAEAVVAYLGDAKRFANGKQVSAYGGLVPRQFQSGQTDRRGRITKRGPALLRKLLVECAWAMLRYNAWARAVYHRLTQGGKVRRKTAVVALARKLLVRCWALMRDGTVWRAAVNESPPQAA